MAGPTRQRVAAAAAVLTDAAALRACWPEPATLAAHLAHPRLWVATDGADAAAGALARTGLWLCAAWLALALVTVFASTFPGLIGRAGEAVAARAVPAFLRRGVAAAIGASVVLTPLAAGASPAGGHPPSPAATVSAHSPSTSAVALSDGWPWPSSAQPEPADRTTTSTHPTTAHPTTAHPTTAHPTTKSPTQTPVPWPHSSTVSPDSGDVVVRPGDCLWAIAAHRLGPQASPHDIAVESRRWYAANTATIGADPSLIHPGQHLHHPTEKGPRS